jgi:putative redox protein
MAETRRKLTFPGHAGDQLAAALEVPEEQPHACALFAHCFTCSKDIIAASRISRSLCRQGIAVLRFDFTGLGNSQGDFANTTFSSNVEDLAAAADFMRQQFSGPEILVGHSLGGAAVVAAAQQIPEAKAVAVIAAPSDPNHVRHLFSEKIPVIEAEGTATVTLAGRKFQIKKKFLEDIAGQNLKEHLARLNRPLLILHSPTDHVVSINHARSNFKAANHPKSFISLDDANHLLTRREDAEWVGLVLSAWASRYTREPQQ